MADEISPAELRELLSSGAPVRIVDIRSRLDFDRGHIPGSESFPMHALPRDVDGLDGAETVVTVCPHGHASKQAASIIESYEGIDDDARVASLEGGIDAWDGELTTDEE